MLKNIFSAAITILSNTIKTDIILETYYKPNLSLTGLQIASATGYNREQWDISQFYEESKNLSEMRSQFYERLPSQKNKQLEYAFALNSIRKKLSQFCEGSKNLSEMRSQFYERLPS